MRVFISHSSKDKDPYCNSVARILREKLGKDSIVYAVDYFCNNIAFFTDDSKKAFCEKLRSRTTSPV